MFSFDLRTIVLLLAAISVLQAAILILFSHLVAWRYPGLDLWAWSTVVNAAGFVLLVARGAIPDFWSIVVGNGALIAAVALGLVAANRFLARPRPWQERFAVCVVVAATASLVPFTFLVPLPAVRTAIINGALGVIELLYAWTLFRAPAPHLRASRIALGSILWISGLWLVFRAGLALTGEPIAGVFSPTVAQTLNFLISLVVLVFWVAGVVALTLQRLLADVRAAQASERATLEVSAQDAERRATEARELLEELAAAKGVVEEREQLFRLTFDRSPLGAALLALDGRFLRANESLERITGYPEGDLLGRDVFALVAAEDQELAREHARALLRGAERVALELRAWRADGTLIWLQLTAGLVYRDAEPLHILALAEDITARKLIEQRLRTIERQQQLVLRTIPEQFWFKDLEGRYILASDSLARFHGRRSEELIGRTAEELYPPALSAFIQAGDDVVRANQEYSAEAQLPDHAGAARWLSFTRAPVFDDDGTPLGIVGVARDITARKRAEAALERRVHELTVLYQITQEVTNWTNLDKGLVPVVSLLCTVFDASVVTVWEYDAAGRRLTPLVGADAPSRRPLRVAEGDALSAALETAPLSLHVLDARHPLLGDSPADGRQALLIPLRTRQLPVGLLCVVPARSDRIYTPEDVALMQTVARVLASAIDNAHLFAQARSAAAEQERRRLARELHDSVSQALFAASCIAESLPQLWELDPVEGREALANLHRFTLSGLAEMRALLVELRPPMLVDSPLHEILAVLAPTARARGVDNVYTLLPETPLLPPDVQVALYRVAQEALNNVVKHARARNVSLTLAVTPAFSPGARWEGTIVLSVVDDGQGFTPGSHGGEHFGLTTMRERAAEIGAELEVDSTPGGGTRVSVCWSGAAWMPADELALALDGEGSQ